MADPYGLPPAEDRYFDDYPLGGVFEYGRLEVTEAQIIAFAELYDPQPMHTDPTFADAGVFGGLIASGWHTASLAMRLYVDHYLTKARSLASPGIDELRWKKPVRPGDRLSIRVTVTEKRPSRSKPDRGMVRALVEALNQDGEVVMSLQVMSLIAKRIGQRR
jgi:acyl dehydratase